MGLRLAALIAFAVSATSCSEPAPTPVPENSMIEPLALNDQDMDELLNALNAAEDAMESPSAPNLLTPEGNRAGGVGIDGIGQ